MDYGPVELDAEPDRIALDLARSAVIVVDMQNDFGSQGGIFLITQVSTSQSFGGRLILRGRSSLRHGTQA